MAYRMTVSLSSILIMALFFPSTSAQSSFSVFGWFTYVNQGELGEYITEYGADYRVLPIANAPFQLCFYNTTPNAFTLAIRLGTRRSESLFRWVWDANRGNPVRDKLVSRVSHKDNSPGPYSLELQYNLYFSSEEWFTVSRRPQSKLTFISSPDDAEGHAYNLILEYYAANSSSGSRILTRPKYNATLSFLRVGSDGNIRIYTYDDKVDWGAWEETYTLFSRDSKDECRTPEWITLEADTGGDKVR